MASVSERTIERWIQRREIPYIAYPRIGSWGGIRFSKATVLKWLERRTMKPVSRPEGAPWDVEKVKGVAR